MLGYHKYLGSHMVLLEERHDRNKDLQAVWDTELTKLALQVVVTSSTYGYLAVQDRQSSLMLGTEHYHSVELRTG
jgi:recombinational DNA repair ATPase RecF